jgi:hypothetical protein
MVGLFFASAAVLTFAFCVVLLREPKAAPTAEAAAPATAPVAATAAAAAPSGASAPASKAAANVTHAAPAAAPKPMHDGAALRHRVVASRHRSVVRRHVYGPRRLVSRGTASSVAAQEPEAASRRPPPRDALDQLLSESSL